MASLATHAAIVILDNHQTQIVEKKKTVLSAIKSNQIAVSLFLNSNRPQESITIQRNSPIQ